MTQVKIPKSVKIVVETEEGEVWEIDVPNPENTFIDITPQYNYPEKMYYLDYVRTERLRSVIGYNIQMSLQARPVEGADGRIYTMTKKAAND